MWLDDKNTVLGTHKALFDRVEAAISNSFISIQLALMDLEVQIQHKVATFSEQQQLLTNVWKKFELEDHVYKIKNDLDVFLAEAGNLRNVRGTLVRAVLLVSSEGDLAQLSRISTLQNGNHCQMQKNGMTFTEMMTRKSQQASFATPRDVGATCFIFYLAPSVTAERLFALFSSVGSVSSVHIPRDRITQQSRGFAFVDFEHAEDAKAAVGCFDGQPLDGKCLTVSIKV